MKHHLQINVQLKSSYMTNNEPKQTRSSAITDGMCDALSSNSCQLLHSCMKNYIWKGLQ